MQDDSLEIAAAEDHGDQGFCRWSDTQMNNETNLQRMMIAVLKKLLNLISQDLEKVLVWELMKRAD